MNRRLTALITLGAAAFLLAGTAAEARAEEVTRWNRIATEAMAAAEVDPLTESRMLAILHLAIHDTLNIDKVRTGDLGGSAGTAAFTQALVSRIANG